MKTKTQLVRAIKKIISYNIYAATGKGKHIHNIFLKQFVIHQFNFEILFLSHIFKLCLRDININKIKQFPKWARA